MNDLAQKLGDGPAIHVAKQTVQNVRVTREGTLVVLQIGNSALRMPWKTAMTVGQWLLSRGTEAKFLDGETQRLVIERDRNTA